MVEGACDGCGNPTARALLWHEVLGFERDRAQGGTNAIALRQRTGKKLCETCVSKLKRGVSLGQQSLGG